MDEMLATLPLSLTRALYTEEPFVVVVAAICNGGSTHLRRVSRGKEQHVCNGTVILGTTSDTAMVHAPSSETARERMGPLRKRERANAALPDRSPKSSG